MDNLPIDARVDSGAIAPLDRQMMQRCLELARRAAGKTSPNPLVGAVVMREGQIVGEGFHPGVGQPHAEVFALKAAGEQANGATVYVNLEPCNHYGRTPPCSEALIAAGVAKVVVGMGDPNPIATGGAERLREAGIEVIIGVEEADCLRLNEAFVHRVRYQAPFGILKYAMTLDGKIATATGHSNWVTGQEARLLVHQERAVCDAVIVGGNTVRTDNPSLTTHDTSDRNPLRVVMSRSFDLPTDAVLWDVEVAPTLVLTVEGAAPQRQQQLRDRGVEVVALPDLTPQSAMTHLYQRQLSRVMWECGGVLAARAIAAGAVQKIMAFIAPKIIGGQSAPSPVGDLGLEQMDRALSLEHISLRAIASDYLLEGYVPARWWDNSRSS